jgi:hypothetical protein
MNSIGKVTKQMGQDKLESYETKLEHMATEWKLDKEWLRSCSYAAKGSNFAFYGREYINILHYLAHEMGLGYVTLENFKLTIRKADILIKRCELLRKKELEILENIDVDLKELETIGHDGSTRKGLSDYYIIALGNINFTSRQLSKLMEIYNVSNISDLDFIYVYIPINSTTIIGASAKAVYCTPTGSNKTENVTYTLNNKILAQRLSNNEKNQKAMQDDPIFEYMPKVLETRLHRIAYSKLMGRSVELMKRISILDSSTEDMQDFVTVMPGEEQEQISFNQTKTNILLDQIRKQTVENVVIKNEEEV